MKILRLLLNYVLLKPVAIISAAVITPLVFILLVVFFPLLWSLLWVYRRIVICLAKFLIPDSKMLSTNDSALSMGVEYKNNHYYITVQSILEGFVSVDDVKKQTQIVSTARNDVGQLQDSELKDSIQNFGGYCFRREVKNFDSANYVYKHREGASGGEMVDKLKLIEIRQKFHNTLFSKNSPLWETMVVNNYRHNNSKDDPECTAVIFKFSHTMCDGFGSLNLLYRGFANSPVEFPKLDKSTVKYKCMKYFLLLKLPVFLLTFIFDSILDSIYKPSRLINSHEWHEPKQPFPEKRELWLAEPVSKAIFREIKSSCNVSVLSVVANVITGGMRRMMVAQKLEPPKYMRVMIPIPKPNHPGTLTNHLSIVVVRIPLSISDCKKRIQATDEAIKEATYGVQRVALNYALQFFGVVPNGLKSIIGFDTFLSALISCTPSPSNDVYMLGHKQLSLSYIMSSCRSKCACIITTFGMGDNFHISFEMNSRLLNQPDEVRDLEKYMLEELEYLGKMCIV